MNTPKNASLERMVEDFLTVSDTYTGSFDTPDPFPLYEKLRVDTPVMEGDILARYGVPSQADYGMQGRPVMSVFRYDDVLNILQDSKNWKSWQNADGFGAAVDNMLLTGMDGDEHQKYRKMLQPAFLMPVIQKIDESLIRPIIKRDFIDKLHPQGKADLVSELAVPFPIRVVYAIFGFPDDQDAGNKFASWALRILGGPQVDPEVAKVTIPAAMEAGEQLFAHVLPIIQARRAANDGRDDLINFMLNVEIEGQKFSDEDITTFVRMLLLAAGETTSRTFANMLVQLFDNPEVLERVRNDRSLIDKVIRETMRREPTASYLARIADQDIDVCGVTVPKGTAVSLSIASANRDPDVYERPDELWIDRPAKRVLAYGFGPHSCMGKHIANIEMAAALDYLLDLPNLRLDPDYPRPAIRGMQMRGADSIRVLWDS